VYTIYVLRSALRFFNKLSITYKKKKLICIGAAESMKNAKIKSIFIPCYMKY
jgi:hypothetical protein